VIHFVIGTKAQLIKMAPVIQEATRQGLPYNFIFTGQHQETMGDLRENFGIREPDVTLHYGKDITSIPAMIVWLARILWCVAFNRKRIFGGDRSGIVVVHGDTFSTLLGALMGKVARLKVAHVESGLRSFNIFHPFPEELTRILTFRLTDEFYCPGDWALQNVAKYKGRKVNTKLNTLLDALRAARERFDSIDVEIPDHKYAVVTTHRFENIFSKAALERNLGLIEQCAQELPLLFILHPVTEKRLLKYGLLDRLQTNPGIECRPRYDYFRFMKLIYHSEFVISDGGSNQEECCYLGKPCLLLRKASERQEGLGSNVVLSKYQPSMVSKFLQSYQSLNSAPMDGNVSPASEIVRHLTLPLPVSR
jgi:UDP-N-acetylglucosamine 2-epimerase (non-hydrolysing)